MCVLAAGASPTTLDLTTYQRSSPSTRTSELCHGVGLCRRSACGADAPAELARQQPDPKLGAAVLVRVDGQACVQRKDRFDKLRVGLVPLVRRKFLVHLVASAFAVTWIIAKAVFEARFSTCDLLKPAVRGC